MSLLTQLQQEAREKFWNLEQQEPEDYDAFLDSLVKHVLEEGTAAMVAEEKEHTKECPFCEGYPPCEIEMGEANARTEQLHRRAQILGNEE